MAHVLVVDPNPVTHRRVEEALTGLGASLLSARDAVEAEARLQAHPVALVLTCTALPKGNGYDLARAARGRYPTAAVYLLAGGFEVVSAERSRDCGISGTLPRPVTTAAVRAVIESVLKVQDLEEASLVEVRSEPEEEAPAAPPAPDATYTPPVSGERVASFLPRDYQQLPLVKVDPDVVGPAVERAILEVLPEVVELVLRRVLQRSTPFRDLVEGAVDEAVRAQLPAIAQRVVQERLAEIEARGNDEA